uniref:Platelet-activating factor acetylhydrolase IB subunit alpha2 n=1 Tax=Sinocyclocheilus grahami TaxID=75366 RepID=A0A672PN40_SINGR
FFVDLHFSCYLPNTCVNRWLHLVYSSYLCWFQVWRELFSPLHALNFGIGGDTTCNVLWRLQNGELENIRPRVVVLWVGTNNHEHTADQVAGGILAIAQLVMTHLPKSKIIVLGLLPRGEFPNPLREKNAAVNNLLRASLPRLGPVHVHCYCGTTATCFRSKHSNKSAEIEPRVYTLFHMLCGMFISV